MIATLNSTKRCLKTIDTFRAHLPLFHYRAMRPGEPWEPLEETLEAFKQRGAPPSFWEDPNPYPDASDVESWLNRSISLVINNVIGISEQIDVSRSDAN